MLLDFSVTNFVDATTGDVVERYHYDPYGDVTFYDGNGVTLLVQESAYDNDVLYTGRRLDTETGLFYYRARWYDPHMGRFISEDPIGFADGPNPYRYAGNNPTLFIDPSGLFPVNAYPLRDFLDGFSINTGSTPSQSGLWESAVNTATGFANAFFPNTSTAISTGIGLAMSSPMLQPGGFSESSSAQTRSGNNSTRSRTDFQPIIVSRDEIPHGTLVREITPGNPIVPRDQRDLPGILEARENAHRFLTVDHNGQGSFVIDLKNGGIREVTGEHYLPITTNMRNARMKAESARREAEFRTIQQELVVMASPHLETGRDASIVFFGYDFIEPNRRVDKDERKDAAFFLFFPGLNSRQVDLADDTLQRFRRRADAPVRYADEFAEGASTQIRIQGDRVYALQPSNGGTGPNRWIRTNRQSRTTHGNTAGNQPATLYERYDADGNFLKHGISQNPATRYSQRELDGGYLIEVQTGPRREILKV